MILQCVLAQQEITQEPMTWKAKCPKCTTWDRIYWRRRAHTPSPKSSEDEECELEREFDTKGIERVYKVRLLYSSLYVYMNTDTSCDIY